MRTIRHAQHQSQHGVLPWLALVLSGFLVALGSLLLLVLLGLR